MDVLKRSLKCALCGQHLLLPITLPCGHSVCKSHTDLPTDEAHIICSKCGIEYSNTKDFVVNEPLSQICAKFGPGQIDFGVTHAEALKSCEKLKELVDSVNFECELYIQDSLDELRNAVLVKREQLKCEVENITQEFLDSLSRCQFEVAQDFLTKKKMLEKEHRDANESVAEWMQCLNEFKVDENMWQNIKFKCDNQIDRLKDRKSRFEGASLGSQFKLSQNNVEHFEQINLVTLIYYNLFTTFENAHDTPIFALTALKNGYLASSADDGSIKIWDPLENTLISTLREKNANDNYTRRSLVELQDGYLTSLYGTHIFAVLENGDIARVDDNTIYILKRDDQIRLSTPHCGYVKHIKCVVALPNGFLASGGAEPYVRIWDASRKYELHSSLCGHTDHICSLLVIKNEFLVSGSADQSIKIWNMRSSYDLVTTLEGHHDSVVALALLKNGFLASGSEDCTIKIWDFRANKLIRTLDGHTGPIRALAILYNGYLASGSKDKTIKIWTVGVGKQSEISSVLNDSKKECTLSSSDDAME